MNSKVAPFCLSKESNCHYPLKDAISASLMCFLPLNYFFVDVSTLSCFHRMKFENNSILAEISLIGAFFPDLILIGFQPLIPSKGYNLFR